MPAKYEQLGQTSLPRRKGDKAGETASARNPERLSILLAEKRRRSVDTLKILTLTDKQQRAIRHPARIRLLLGSNRASKTSILLVDAALVVCGWHPTRKYKPGYHGRLYFVGKDAKALGEVFYRKLRGWGEFKIIKDKETKQWRSYNENIEPERAEQAEMAPPLIPDRLIFPDVKRGSTFHRFKTKELKKLVVKNDLGQIWHLDFFTSLGDPPRGANIDGVYFSEEIENPEWYNEMRMRLLDRKGFLFWDAAQQDGSDALSELENRADQEAHLPDPRVWKDRWGLYDNPYIPKQEIEDAKRDLTSEDEIRVRIYGEAATKKIRLFPEFAVAIHEFKRILLPGGQVPANWTRYLSFDPGYETAAALFIAVPPPDYEYHPNLVLAYDEMYVWGKSIDEHIEILAAKCSGQNIYAFIGDSRQLSKHDASGVTSREQYYRAMLAKNMQSEASGFNFWDGPDDVRAGCELVRSALRRQFDGKPRFMFLEDSCPNLVNELRSIKRDRTKSKYRSMMYLDVPAKGQNDHCFDTLRYALGRDPVWHKPREGKNWVSERIKRLDQYLRGNRGQGVVLGARPRQPVGERP